jgi:hypothetical protein
MNFIESNLKVTIYNGEEEKILCCKGVYEQQDNRILLALDMEKENESFFTYMKIAADYNGTYAYISKGIRIEIPINFVSSIAVE